MLAPRKIPFEAKKKRNENYAFRIYLKTNADEKSWMNSFKSCTMNCLPAMTAADAETAVRCTAEVFQKRIWSRTQTGWGLRKSS